jgi:RHS repeat-associated protein
LSNHLGNVLVTVTDKKLGHDGGSGLIDYYTSDVATANDYYPFGMLMPGRTNNAANYRFGFGGQEMNNDLKGIGNSYTSEFWEYDPRLARRFNVDPIFKEDESPYAAFGNNPIWNVDPSGADTAKYLTNSQLRDALKIGAEVVRKRVNSKSYKYWEEEDQNELRTKSQEYWKAHQSEMTFGAYAEFEKAVIDYHRGVASLAQWDGAAEFEKLDRSVINNNKLNDYQAVDLSRGRIRQAEAKWGAVWTLSMASVEMVTMGTIGIRAGNGPRAPYKSNTQQRMVDQDVSTFISERIRDGKQASMHTAGGKQLGTKSYLNSVEDARTVLRAVHSGEVNILARNASQNRLYVQYDNVTGYYNNNGTIIETHRFLIKGGGSNGATVVPIHPNSGAFK